MKTYEVVAQFPQALAKHAFQQARVSAGSWHRASALALRDITKREGIKGKRLTQVKLSMVIVDTTKEES